MADCSYNAQPVWDHVARVGKEAACSSSLDIATSSLVKRGGEGGGTGYLAVSLFTRPEIEFFSWPAFVLIRPATKAQLAAGETVKRMFELKYETQRCSV